MVRLEIRFTQDIASLPPPADAETENVELADVITNEPPVDEDIETTTLVALIETASARDPALMASVA